MDPKEKLYLNRPSKPPSSGSKTPSNFVHPTHRYRLEYAKLKASGLTKRQMGPALAGVLDTKTGKYYFAINSLEIEPPVGMINKLTIRVDEMPLHVRNGYQLTRGAGTHAEVFALHQAWLARPNAEISDFMLYVINAAGRATTRGLPIPRCPHCEYITDGIKYIPETLIYGKK